jgi:hypothetical protein
MTIGIRSPLNQCAYEPDNNAIETYLEPKILQTCTYQIHLIVTPILLVLFITSPTSRHRPTATLVHRAD